MASFKALNIESDDESEIEIDDTKEIQIEEALKLYQTALKHHSDGPDTYIQAAAAYEELFKSDIFKYPESQSEIRRIEALGPLAEQDIWIEDQIDEFVEPLINTDNAPSTLPQILHLAHKNYGAFILDDLAARSEVQDANVDKLSWSEIRDAATSALDHFVEALDKDESDLEVWKQTSTVGTTLKSSRIVRFCLEAIIDDDEISGEDLLALADFSVIKSSQNLCRLVENLGDTLSLLQSPLNQVKRKKLRQVLQRRIDALDSDKSTYGMVGDQREALRLSETNHTHVTNLPMPTSWTDFAVLVSSVPDNNSHDESLPSVGGIVTFSLTNPQMNGHTEDAMEVDLGNWLPHPGDFDSVFPGLDRGIPTIPRAVFGDVSKLQVLCKQEWHQPTMPTRKRSSDLAGIEAPDTGRVKSKRIRARESLAEGLPVADLGPSSAKKVKKDPYEDLNNLDVWCFASADELLKSLQAQVFGSLASHRPTRSEDSEKSGNATGASILTIFSPNTLQPAKDLYELLVNTPDRIPRLSAIKSTEGTSEAGSPQNQVLAALDKDAATNTKPPKRFPMDPRGGLDAMLETLNKSFLSLPEVGFVLGQLLFRTGVEALSPSLPTSESSYTGHSWSDSMKSAVSKILVTCDEYIYHTIAGLLEDVVQNPPTNDTGGDRARNQNDLESLVELVQSIYEVHLEIFSQIRFIDPSQALCSINDQRPRAERWADLTKDAMELRRICLDDSTQDDDPLGLRYIWATATQAKLTDSLDQASSLRYLHEVRHIFVALKEPTIYLPNNSLMPVLSLEAIDRDIAKLTTSDFFSRVFDSSQGDPAAIIEGLEPLLEHVHRLRMESAGLSSNSVSTEADMANTADGMTDVEEALPASQDLIEFLCKCSSSVLLALWQRLLSAYTAIEYPPMVAVCHFRTIEILVAEIESPGYSSMTQTERQTTFLSITQRVHDSLVRVLDMTKVNLTVLECMDGTKLKSLATSLVKLLNVLHYSNFAEDEIRVGDRPAPFEKDAARSKTYRLAVKLLSDCQLSCWIALYTVFQEAAGNDPDVLSKESYDVLRMEYFRSVHSSTGLRGFCGGSNRILLNLLKKEMPTLRHVQGYDLEYSQVLLDLYNLDCFVNPSWEQLPHECTRDVSLDRAAAVQIVDLLLLQATKIKPNELYKHPIKDAFERVHMVVARKKPSDTILRNREIFTQFMQSPINPLDLYRCLNGEGEMNLIALPDNLASLANKGWYFTMGWLALTKFKSQKRVAPGPTDELDTAISFFTQDLEYGAEKWETWFRLGQAYDSRLEDNVTWNADRINKSRDEIAQLQRSAIHCYRMATALATRISDPDFESSANVAELYANFATRIYASSREPFEMQAFDLQDATKFLSTNGLVKIRPFQPLQETSAWKLAKVLYQRAIAGNPKNWSLHYMLGKCLWKLFVRHADEDQTYCDPMLVVSAFQKSIELLPRERKDRKEPTLEPHYKIVVIVHKLMTQRRRSDERPLRAFDVDTACDLINSTPYARKVSRCEDIDEWDDYILNVLKQLRNADKANWHHRMIVRSALIIYGEGDEERDYAAALGARHELTQQLFTKTMVLQVWRPDFERPGRHFVYTRKYTDFFVQILRRIGDRASMEQLVRRVRKKMGDYFEFDNMWTLISFAYLAMIRKQSRTTVGQELSTFVTMEQSEFSKRKEILEKWCHEPEVKDQTLDALREIIEFKKINQGLEKPGAIDELIGDLYALLFETVGKKLWIEQGRPNGASNDAEKRQEQIASALNLNKLTSSDGRPHSKALETVAGMSANQETPSPGELTPVRRRTGIGRREVRNAAEACVTKAAPPPPPPVVATDIPKREFSIVIPRRMSGISSRPMSVHDSADESELSDVDEDVVKQGQSPSRRPSMFPGLVKAALAEDEERDEEDEEEGGEEEGEEDGDEEGEGEEVENNDGQEDEEGDEDEDQGDVEMYEDAPEHMGEHPKLGQEVVE